MTVAQRTAGLLGAVQNAWQARWVYLIAFLAVFALTYWGLVAFDFVPDPSQNAADAPRVTLTASPLVTGVSAATLSPNVIDAFAQGEQPVKISIPSISLSATIANPTTTNVEKLDQYLLKGAVRYPTSGLLGANGNVVLFGHSSYLPIVNNLAYKTFDGIQKLHAGDKITVYSSDYAYVYAVDAVKQMDATSDAIPLTVNGQMLTLSTCDSFGEKTDRFVVTAHFVERTAL